MYVEMKLSYKVNLYKHDKLEKMNEQVYSRMFKLKQAETNRSDNESKIGKGTSS